MVATLEQTKQHDEREAAWAAANKAESDYWEQQARENDKDQATRGA